VFVEIENEEINKQH